MPVLGVVPYINVEIDDEDSLSEKMTARAKESRLDIAVVRLPRISNFTDFNVLEYMEDVSVRYVRTPRDFGKPDLLILPGTKNTMADLLHIRQSGMEAKILKYAAKGKPIIGICGGYQMLGQKLSDPHGVEHGGEIDGMQLLPHGTIFSLEKVTRKTAGRLSDVSGIFRALSGKEFNGYEIHMGLQESDKNIINSGNVYGTYIHGIFDKSGVAAAVVEALFKEKGLEPKENSDFDLDEYKQEQYDTLAEAVEKSLDVNMLLDIINGSRAHAELDRK